MAKKNKREMVSVSKSEKLITDGSFRIPVVANDGDEIIIEVRTFLPLDEAMSFVNNIAEFVIDSEFGDYIPEAFDFAVRINTMAMFGNITLPSNIEKQYALAYNTDIYKTITSVLSNEDSGQLSDLIYAARQKVTYRVNMSTSSASLQIQKLMQAVNDLTEQTASAFSGVDADSIAQTLDILKKTEKLDEAKIAKTIWAEQEQKIIMSEISDA